MIRSFRIRLAFWSAVIAGLALAGFAGTAWWSIYQAKISMIDANIRAVVLGQSDQVHSQQEWAVTELELPTLFGHEKAASLWVQTVALENIYVSGDWPRELSPELIFKADKMALNERELLGAGINWAQDWVMASAHAAPGPRPPAPGGGPGAGGGPGTNRPGPNNPAPGNAPGANNPAPGNGPGANNPAPGNGPRANNPAPGNGPGANNPAPGNGPGANNPTPGNGPGANNPTPGNGPRANNPAPGNGPGTNNPAPGNGPGANNPAPGNGPGANNPAPGNGPGANTPAPGNGPGANNPAPGNGPGANNPAPGNGPGANNPTPGAGGPNPPLNPNTTPNPAPNVPPVRPNPLPTVNPTTPGTTQNPPVPTPNNAPSPNQAGGTIPGASTQKATPIPVLGVGAGNNEQANPGNPQPAGTGFGTGAQARAQLNAQPQTTLADPSGTDQRPVTTPESVGVAPLPDAPAGNHSGYPANPVNPVNPVNPGQGASPIKTAAEFVAAAANAPMLPSFKVGNLAGRWRVGSVSTRHGRIAIAVDLKTIHNEMAPIRKGFMWAIPLALLIISSGAWWLSGRMLLTLKKISNSIETIKASELDKRVTKKGVDHEFENLIDSFNKLLERLSRSFAQASRFSADAAHELKTPLAILQGELERAIQSEEESSPIQRTLSGLLDQVQRLATISRKLLLLSHADAGRMTIRKEQFDLAPRLEELLEDLNMVAPELDLRKQLSPTLILSADIVLVMQVMQNLLSNAVKYNVKDGWLAIGAERFGPNIRMSVANSTIPNLVIDRKRMFERFYRADSTRNTVEGSGLGLSLSREIIRAHGGELRLEDAPQGQIRFTLIIPVKGE